MSTVLLDANVLVALVVEGHVHGDRCRRWFAGVPAFATCPMTEGTLLRMLMIHAADPSAASAWETLARIHRHPRHRFWGEGHSFLEVDPARLTGHRQVTDGWLVHLARRHGARLATLDEGLAVLWPDVAFLVPV